MTNAPTADRGAQISGEDKADATVTSSTPEAPEKQDRDHHADRHRVKRGHDQRDRLTKPKAQRLAERIRSFWQAKGRAVRVWVEPIDDSIATEWCVRSTLMLTEREPRR